MRGLARLAGALALALVVLGPFSMLYLPPTLYVPGNAAETAQKILANEGLFRLGILSDLTICAIEVVLLTLLYALFKPVNPVVSLMAAFARLAMTVVQGMNVTLSIAVLLLVSSHSSEQAQLALGPSGRRSSRSTACCSAP